MTKKSAYMSRMLAALSYTLGTMNLSDLTTSKHTSNYKPVKLTSNPETIKTLNEIAKEKRKSKKEYLKRKGRKGGRK